MDRVIPFPQADDFEKIVTILNIPREEDLNNSDRISASLGDISERQVAYYLSATEFLGLIELVDGRRTFSKKGLALRKMNSVMQVSELISLILMNPVFNKTYVNTMMFGKQEIADVETIIERYYPGYSEAIYHRRAQTVISWVDWIIKKLSKNS